MAVAPTYSGTTAFAPTVGSMAINAFGRCGIRRTMLTAEHMADAQDSTNFLLSSWSNLQPQLWSIELRTEPMLDGVATYTLDADMILILDAYRHSDDSGQSTDILLTPISRTDYASLPNKELEGVPTTYWLNRQIIPEVSLWQVPNVTGTYSFKYYCVRQLSDANLAGGQNPELPYRFFDAFAAGLAAKLAQIYAYDRWPALEAAADKAWTLASQQDTEQLVPMYISPGIGGYYR